MRVFRSGQSALFLSFLFVFLTVSSIPVFAQVNAGLSDEELLDTISEKAFAYFQYEKQPATGLVADRAHNFKRGGIRAMASIAATGFGLTSLGIGVERGWIDRSTALETARRTLNTLLYRAPQEHGFFYHFLSMKSAQRGNGSELSSIDTALLLAGVLFVSEYFQDASLSGLARQIYERVDWTWMLHGGDTLAMAWSPEQGFSKRRWEHYDESMIMYLLAIGSPTYPIPASSWQKISRPVGSYGGYHVIQMPPLFAHQYSHLWIDFRDKNDGYADYFLNSVNASLANRQFCMDQSSRFRSYGRDAWGLTASDGPFGYKAYGAPPGWAVHDGTIAPTGCGSSIMFTPEESLSCLRHLYEDLGDRLWGQYGFSDSFNLDKDWYSEQVLGIDQGALLLAIENYRSGLVWNVMKQNVWLEKAMQAVGFRPGSWDVPWPDPPSYTAPHVENGIKIDGFFKDWPQSEAIFLDKGNREVGTVTDDRDLKAEIRFAWSYEALYFSAMVADDSVLVRKTGQNIWMDDLVEIYIDPEGDGLQWKDDRDFQIGFRPHSEDDGVEIWSWFQPEQDELPVMVAARGFVDNKGYLIEGGIRWKWLGISPFDISKVKLSVAVHDIDSDRSEGKLQWFFRNEGGLEKFNLGNLILEKKPS